MLLIPQDSLSSKPLRIKTDTPEENKKQTSAVQERNSQLLKASDKQNNKTQIKTTTNNEEEKKKIESALDFLKEISEKNCKDNDIRLENNLEINSQKSPQNIEENKMNAGVIKTINTCSPEKSKIKLTKKNQSMIILKKEIVRENTGENIIRITMMTKGKSKYIKYLNFE